MRETYLAVAGVVATDPTVRTLDDGRQVMSFRVASTSRRYDTAAKSWVDGPTLWVRVSCWRELADNAAKCVRKRDRILAWGRVRSEQWTTEGGGMRNDLALEAEAIGHDLTFGVSVFDRKTRTVAERILTDAPVVDPMTGEIVAMPSVPSVPAGPGGPAVPAPAQAAAEPPEDELDPELGEEPDDELDDEGFEGGAGRPVEATDARKEELVRSA